MIKNLAIIVFYSLMAVVGLLSALMIYVLLRFGKSKMLGLTLSILYGLLILSLYAAAEANLRQVITF